MTNVSTAVANIFNGNTAQGMLRFNPTPFNLDRRFQGLVTTECQQIVDRLKYHRDDLDFTNDKNMTALIMKVGGRFEEKFNSTQYNYLPRIGLYREEFCQALIANPDALTGDKTHSEIIEEYVAKKTKFSKIINITEETSLKDFHTHCQNPYATVEITDCGNDWLAENLPEHIRANLVTDREEDVILANVKTASDILASRTDKLQLPDLITACDIVCNHIEAPSLKRAKGEVQALRFVAPKLQEARKIEIGGPDYKDINFPELTACDLLYAYGSGDASAPKLIHLGYGWFDGFSSVDISAVTSTERGVTISNKDANGNLTKVFRSDHASRNWFKKISDKGHQLFAPPSNAAILPPPPHQRWTPTVIDGDKPDGLER